MRKPFATLFILLSYVVVAHAQQVSYSVDLRHTDRMQADVTVFINGSTAQTASYQMPIWAPGAYSVTNYGRFVRTFKAFDRNNNELPVTMIDSNRWEIANGKKLAKLTYSVINSYKDSTSLYFALCQVDSNYFFANGTCLFGYVNDKKNIPSTVTYLIPHGWTAYTATNTDAEPELSDDKLIFHAENYDELADAPVMAGNHIEHRSFEEDGAYYDIAFASDDRFQMDSLVEYTRKIVKAECDFFGGAPFKRYTFLIDAPSWGKLPTMAMGALEHANSSAYLLINLPWSTFRSFSLNTISHEFFHLWNVKRIHSDKLGPFDYTKRVMSTSLWLSEGVTDYYAQTLLTRNGILPPEFFEAKIAEWYGQVLHSKSLVSETLEQLSIDESDLDLSKATNFYTKGPLVAMMLDIEIRTRTNNKMSLDDVMHALYAKAKNGDHFSDEGLIGTIEKISGLDLQDFYHRYVAGTDTLPLASYLLKMGLLKDYTYETHSGASFRAHFTPNIDHVVIDSFYNAPASSMTVKSSTGQDSTIKRSDHVTTDLEAAGLMKGDTILSINGKPMNPDKIDEFSINAATPITIQLLIGRNGGRFERTVTLRQPRSSMMQKKSVAPNPNATDK